MVANDTTLGAILKCYAIRRDITAYFRLIWRPVFPSVLVLAAKGDIKNRAVGGDEGGGYHPEATIGTSADTAVDSAVVLADTFAIATRILELTLKTSVISSFPPGATSVCRALFQIGG